MQMGKEKLADGRRWVKISRPSGGAGWVQARHLASTGAGVLAGVWGGSLVIAVAVAGLHLDASLLAALRLITLMGLAIAWAVLRLAGGCVRAAEAMIGLAVGGLPQDAPAPSPMHEEQQRQPA